MEERVRRLDSTLFRGHRYVGPLPSHVYLILIGIIGAKPVEVNGQVLGEDWSRAATHFDASSEVRAHLIASVNSHTYVYNLFQ